MLHIPLMAGDWKTMSPAQSTHFQLRLRNAGVVGAHDPTPFAEVLHGRPRYLALSCYPGWVLTELDVTVSPGEIGTINVMYGPGALWLIDGSSTGVHLANAGELQPAPDKPALPPALGTLDAHRSGPDYLRFFCGAVWGPDGPFSVIEDATHPLLAQAGHLADWASRIAPVVVEDAEHGLVGTATVAYGHDLFRARLSITQGLVSMDDDEMIAQDAVPPRRHLPPVRDLRPLTPTPLES